MISLLILLKARSKEYEQDQDQEQELTYDVLPRTKITPAFSDSSG
jgi:hypothetical protein